MGGRAAEDVFFAKEGVTTGCGSDLRSATMTAYRMLLASAMGRGLLTADLEELSERRKAELEAEVRGLLEVGLEAELWEGARNARREQRAAQSTG